MSKQENLIGQPVRSLQTMLRVIAQAEPGIGSICPDGVFGMDTKRAVIAFQRTHGLTANGIVDETTWNTIADAYEEDYVNLIKQPTLCPALSPMQEIAPQEENCHVCLIQALLHVMAQRYINLPDPPMNGCYDAETQESVLQFKKLCGHSDSTAAIDRPFLQELFSCYRCVTGNGRSE